MKKINIIINSLLSASLFFILLFVLVNDIGKISPGYTIDASHVFTWICVYFGCSVPAFSLGFNIND
jgi:nucleoside recognition membrane protein YjiH